MPRNLVILISVLTVCALVYTIVLHLTGQHAAAADFVKFACSGIMTLAFVALFLH